MSNQQENDSRWLHLIDDAFAIDQEHPLLSQTVEQVEQDEPESYNIDSDLRNADWLKTLGWDLPTSPDRFLRAIGGRQQLAHFMTLPAAEAMPAELRAALAGPKRRSPIVSVGGAGLVSSEMPEDDPRSRTEWREEVSSGETALGYEDWFQVRNSQIAAENYEQSQLAGPPRSRLIGDGEGLIFSPPERTPDHPLGLLRWREDVSKSLTELSYAAWVEQRSAGLAELARMARTKTTRIRLAEKDKEQLLDRGEEYKAVTVYVERSTGSAWFGRQEGAFFPEGEVLEWSKSEWIIDTHVPAGEDSYGPGELVWTAPEDQPVELSKSTWLEEVRTGLTTLGYTEWRLEELNEFGRLRMQFEADHSSQDES